MNTKLKKILIIIITILIIVLIGFLFYNFFIKKPEPIEYGPGEFPEGEKSEFIPEQEEFVPQAEVKIKSISKDPVLSATLKPDKKGVIYYLRSNGNVWQSDFNGDNLFQVSDSVLDNLIKIIWSPDKNKVINIFQDILGNISKYFYSFETGKALPLNKYINYISWSSDSNKIAYQYQNEFTGDNTINIANPDGSSYSVILNTRMKDLIIEWPKGEGIFLREKPSGLVQSSLYSLSPLTKAFAKIISDIYGFSIKWSSNGDKILYSQTDSKGKSITIFTVDRNASNQKSAKISTLAEKCVWSQDSRIIFCAVPKNIKDADILPDDFYKGTFRGDDEFWKINIETNDITKLLDESQLTETYDATNLFVSPKEDYLFFINKINGLLYSIEL